MKTILSVFVLIIVFTNCRDAKKDVIKERTSQSFFTHLELPKYGKHDSIIHHSAYSLSFNKEYHQANWLAYCLTRSETNSIFKRGNNFKADPLVPGTDLAVSYYKSGYDRGHLAPAADMGFSEIAMNESFYYSNMSPQVASFNRGVWKKLETKVRKWAAEYDSLYIVTGPVFSDSIPIEIGTHRVAVPNSFYKVLLQHRGEAWEAIGFLLKNEGSKQPLSAFTLTIDEVETVTGIDFFPLLEDALEENVEGGVCFECWEL